MLVSGGEVWSQIQSCGAADNSNNVSLRAFDNPEDAPQILGKPGVVLPTDLRSKTIVGNISLKVTFLATGKIGQIKIVKGLQKDLDGRVIKAARKIRFIPAKKNGKRVTVIKIVNYEFYDRRKCLPTGTKGNSSFLKLFGRRSFVD